MKKTYAPLLCFTDAKGQNSVEFVLILGVVVTLLGTVFSLFHTNMAGLFFFLIGSLVG